MLYDFEANINYLEFFINDIVVSLTNEIEVVVNSIFLCNLLFLYLYK